MAIKKLFQNIKTDNKTGSPYSKALSDLGKVQNVAMNSLKDTQQYYGKAQQIANFLTKGKSANLLQSSGINKSISIFNKYQSEVFNRMSQIRGGLDGINNFIGIVRDKKKKEKGGDEAWFNANDPNYKPIEQQDVNKTNNNLNGKEILISPPEHIADNSIANVTEFEDKTNKLGDTIYKGWAFENRDITPTLEQPFWQRNADFIRKTNSLPGSFKFYIEKLHGFDLTGNPYKVNEIQQTGNNKWNNAKNFQNRMVFPVFLETWSESFTPSYNSINLIGKSEPIRVYDNTTRNLTLSFNVLADFSSEIMLSGVQELQKYSTKNYTQRTDLGIDQQILLLNNAYGDFNSLEEYNKVKPLSPVASKLTDTFMTLPEQKIAYSQLQNYINTFDKIWSHGSTPISQKLAKGDFGFTPSSTTGTPEMMWNKLTFLAQCCYPYYRKDGKLKESPMIKLRLGDFFDCICVISSLSINDMEMGWDLNFSNNIGVIPMGVKIDLSLDIIHQDMPSSTYNRFYHRKDYDMKPYNYIPGTLGLSLSKDELIDKLLEDSNFRNKVLGDEINISSGPASVTVDPKEIKTSFDGINQVEGLLGDNDLSAFNYKISGSLDTKSEKDSIVEYAENLKLLSDKFDKLPSLPSKEVVNNFKTSEVVDLSAKVIKSKNKLKNLYSRVKDSPVTKNLNKLAKENTSLIKRIFNFKNDGLNLI